MIIYKIINSINNKIYVGQTSKSSEYRFKKHVKDALKSDRPYAIHSAMRKYGAEKFSIEMIQECSTFEEANTLEAYYIEQLNSLCPNGYNIRPGGNNSPHSESTKDKISQSKIGGKLSESHKRHISESGKGRVGCWKGKKLPDEAKIKMSISRTGKPGTNNRSVICLETSVVYDSVSSAAKHFGCSPSKIYRVCQGKRKTTRGFSFRFKD